jgi:hypothetical protein
MFWKKSSRCRVTQYFLSTNFLWLFLVCVRSTEDKIVTLKVSYSLIKISKVFSFVLKCRFVPKRPKIDSFFPWFPQNKNQSFRLNSFFEGVALILSLENICGIVK